MKRKREREKTGEREKNVGWHEREVRERERDEVLNFRDYFFY